MSNENRLLYRVGQGFDLHRLAERPSQETGSGIEGGDDKSSDKPMLVCGVHLKECEFGPVCHSDGDAVYHAVTDALLGAVGEPDIGEIFPDTSPKWANADSAIFVREAVARIMAMGYTVGNIDVTIILEKPRISNYKDTMRINLANLLEIPVDCANVKGKTHEKMGLPGEGRAIAVHCTVLLKRRDKAGF